MQASIVVLSALMAVATAQFLMPLAGVMPMNPYLGVPLDTPEVAMAKAHHFAEYNRVAARDHGILFRKRREAPAPEVAPEAAVPAEGDHPQAKRQIFPYFRSSLWGAPYPYYSLPAYGYLRKRRDTAAVEEPKETAVPAQSNKEKRQLLAYSAAWSPYSWGSYAYATPYASIYTHPFAPFLRKRRDTAAVNEAPETHAAEETPRDKRQLLPLAYPYAAATYPYAPAITTYAAAYSPFSYMRYGWY